MKGFLVFVLSVGAACAATFTTGQAARLVIGQTTFTAQEQGARADLLGGVSGLAFANNTLFVADSNRVGSTPVNNRVLIYPNITGTLPQPTDQLQYNTVCPVCVGQASVVLGQPDFTTTTPTPNINTSAQNPVLLPATASGLHTPTAVASDGVHLVVADSDNNRVLIWNSIPVSNDQPADVVVGQNDFTTFGTSVPPTATSLRGPQGVWIQNGKLYIADTQNDRILIYNQIPTKNGAAADLVLGQPNMTTWIQTDLTQQKSDATATNILNPISVTSDGTRLYVSDLGHNRVLIWNSIPTVNQAPADLAVGQPDMVSSIANNAFTTDSGGIEHPVLCSVSNGTDSTHNNAPTYPSQCESTLSFPRYALSDGQRLFIADGGNDRVLVFNAVPTKSGQSADVILGQIGGQVNQASDAADSMRTPLSLAWDGMNLYVSDAYNRRINVFTMANPDIPYSGVRNAASLNVYANGTVAMTGTARANDTVKVTINGTDYTYTVKTGDDLNAIVNGLVALINANSGDANVIARANLSTSTLLLTARKPNTDGNSVTLAVATSPSDATETATTSGANLTGGYDAASIGPGSLVTIFGQNLADSFAYADGSQDSLPRTLGGAQVYFDGVQAPLVYVSPTQINAQMPFEFISTTSVNAYVRTQHADGTVSVTAPMAVTIVPRNPGVFAYPGAEPRQGVVLHGSSYATGTVSVDGSINAGDVATVKIEDRTYNYTVKAGDTLATIRDALIALINAGDPKVEAYPAGVFTRIRLRAREVGPDGDGIVYTASAGSGAQVIMTATTPALCCANVAYSLVTTDNPAQPGETVIVYATGLGNPTPADGVVTGTKYPGGTNQPQALISSLAGGKTANVLYAGLAGGMFGIWEVHLELNSSLPTDAQTQMYVAADPLPGDTSITSTTTGVSNIVTFPVVSTTPPTP